jgi:hypothetical protein
MTAGLTGLDRCMAMNCGWRCDGGSVQHRGPATFIRSRLCGGPCACRARHAAGRQVRRLSARVLAAGGNSQLLTIEILEPTKRAELVAQFNATGRRVRGSRRAHPGDTRRDRHRGCSRAGPVTPRYADELAPILALVVCGR